MKKLITLFSLILSMLIMSTAWADFNSDLFEAADKGNKKKVAALIKKGANINAKTVFGMTPLHFAAREGHTEIAKLLINKGADVNTKNNKGQTPMDLARSDEMKKLLKNAGEKGEISIQTASTEQEKVKIFIRKLIPGLKLKNILPYAPNETTSYVQLYPIGFSKKGHFAYIKRNHSITSEEYFWKLNIFNFNNDKEVVSYDITSKNKNKILTKLKRYKIIVSKRPLALRSFPLKRKGDRYNAVIKCKKGCHEDDERTTHHIILISKKLGQKKISIFKAISGFKMKPSISGYLASPYENKIIVVITYWQKAFEYNSEIPFKLTGSHLRSRFSKKR